MCIKKFMKNLGIRLILITALFAGGGYLTGTNQVEAKSIPITKTVAPKVVNKQSSVVKKVATPVRKNLLVMKGQTIGLQNSQGSGAAPYNGKAGYWWGSGSTVDGKTTHIIGHNPGIFKVVLSLRVGDQIKLTDSQGKTRTYKVYALLDVNDNGRDRKGQDQWRRVLGQKGESISLQTCINDYWNRMVLAR